MNMNEWYTRIRKSPWELIVGDRERGLNKGKLSSMNTQLWKAPRGKALSINLVLIWYFKNILWCARPTLSSFTVSSCFQVMHSGHIIRYWQMWPSFACVIQEFTEWSNFWGFLQLILGFVFRSDSRQYRNLCILSEIFAPLYWFCLKS